MASNIVITDPAPVVDSTTARDASSRMTLTSIPPRHAPHVDYNSSGQLTVDEHKVSDLVDKFDTPLYIYSSAAATKAYARIRDAFESELAKYHHLHHHDEQQQKKKSSSPPQFGVHFAVKANCSLAILRALAAAGSGMDCVSAHEVRKALMCGCPPERIVFAGVGKTEDELRYCVKESIGCINIENERELETLQKIAEEYQKQQQYKQEQDSEGGGGPAQDNKKTNTKKISVALRLNPDVKASTHPSIATGHKAAKFGIPTERVRHILEHRAEMFPLVTVMGLHVHIGSQLGSTDATLRAIKIATDMLQPYKREIHHLNIGGGFPVPYEPADADLPEVEDFAREIVPLVGGEFDISVEPGRYIIARAGVLVTRVLYRKEQDGKRIAIVDASMAELMRPALYDATHACVHVNSPPPSTSSSLQKKSSSSAGEDGDADDDGDGVQRFEVVGGVCETTDNLASAYLSDKLVQPGCLLAFCTAGAYCSTMFMNYNARCRPPEVVVKPGDVLLARRREKFEDLIRDEI